jgi:hypothetical protein
MVTNAQFAVVAMMALIGPYGTVLFRIAQRVLEVHEVADITSPNDGLDRIFTHTFESCELVL